MPANNDSGLRITLPETPPKTCPEISQEAYDVFRSILESSSIESFDAPENASGDIASGSTFGIGSLVARLERSETAIENLQAVAAGVNPATPTCNEVDVALGSTSATVSFGSSFGTYTGVNAVEGNLDGLRVTGTTDNSVSVEWDNPAPAGAKVRVCVV